MTTVDRCCLLLKGFMQEKNHRDASKSASDRLNHVEPRGLTAWLVTAPETQTLPVLNGAF
jgi:hypothetical protein